MHYPDLSPYCHDSTHDPSPALLNVGWLDPAHPFPTGAVPQAALERLFAACLRPVQVMRGWHPCLFCEPPVPPAYAGYPVCAARGGRNLALGSAEIRVVGAGGVTYAAPNLIYHYVERHAYLPPPEFVAALLHPEV